MSMINNFAAHPWLRDENPGLLLDFSIYKLVKSYIRASPFRRAALKVIVCFSSCQDFLRILITIFMQKVKE